jgi:hypothetical protein
MMAAVASACAGESTRTPLQPETITLPLRLESQGSAAAGGQTAKGETPENHRAHLSGDQEVFTPPTPGGPTPADSNAQGQGIFQISKGGNSFDYKLIASNINNIVQAHIHCGLPGTNGPIVVWLYPSVTSTTALTGPTGRHDGVLAEGTVEADQADHLREVGANAACPGGVANWDELLTKMRTGGAYVNVHTNDGVAPPNSGPGDFQGGEIRGQF